MAKGTKTARELEDMIMDQVGIGGVFVAVRKEGIAGWNADVVTAPAGGVFRRSYEGSADRNGAARAL
jgi:hypothetical protein